MSLKRKTVSGLLWSTVDNVSSMGITFVLGIVLARMLGPRDFGLIGMTTVFVAIASTFINAGFNTALVRKQDCTQTDYSTVFYFNLVVAICLYVVLFVCAPAISIFYDEPKLINILRILGITLIISSISLVQHAILVKRVDFKLQTKITIAASILSGAVAIYLAFRGFGVWSLVAKILISTSLTSLLLWLFNRWRPAFSFSLQSFREMFSFGSKLLASSIMDTAWRNTYTLIIGKYFSAETLGFFSRAEMLINLPASNLSRVVSRVGMPVLCQIQDDHERTRNAFSRILGNSMFISFLLLAGISAVAEPLILTLLGEAWRESIPILQLLCIGAFLYPFHALNLSLLNVYGRSDLFLKVEIIKIIQAIPVIVLGIKMGMAVLLLGMAVTSYLSLYWNSQYAGRLIGFSTIQQLKAMAPSFLMAAGMYALVRSLEFLFNLSPLPLLILQVLFGALVAVGLGEFFKNRDYLDLKQIIHEKVSDILKQRKTA